MLYIYINITHYASCIFHVVIKLHIDSLSNVTRNQKYCTRGYQKIVGEEIKVFIKEN